MMLITVMIFLGAVGLILAAAIGIGFFIAGRLSRWLWPDDQEDLE